MIIDTKPISLLGFPEFEFCLKLKRNRILLRQNLKNGVKTVEVPWANPGSGFTLLFELFALQMSMCMSIKEVAKILDETENRIWRIAKHYTEKALDDQDFSKEPIKTLAMDEVSRKKGHVYITNFVDVDTRKVVFVAEGKSADTIRQFKEEYLRKGGKESDIKTLIMWCFAKQNTLGVFLHSRKLYDMFPAFIKGAKKEFPKAQIVFDKFHVMKILNEQLDKVRRMEFEKKIPRSVLRNSREQQKFGAFFNKTKYLFLRLQENLTIKQKKWLDRLLEDETNGVLQSKTPWEYSCKAGILHGYR